MRERGTSECLAYASDYHGRALTLFSLLPPVQIANESVRRRRVAIGGNRMGGQKKWGGGEKEGG